MPAKNKTKSKKTAFEKTLNMKEPELFKRVEKVFLSKGFTGQSLVNQVRIALAEWCDAREK